jgi:single-strand DNA-binding protein
MRSTTKGILVCTFTLASNRFFKKGSAIENEAGFFDVETWGKLAEYTGSSGRKGRGVRVVGRLKQNRWTGTDGKPRSKIIIVAEHVEFKPEFSNRMNQNKGLEESETEEASVEERTIQGFEEEE